MPKLCIPDAVAPRSSRLRPCSFPALAPLTEPSPAACHGVQWWPLLCGATAFALLIMGPVANAQPITGEPPTVLTTADHFAVFIAEAAERFDIPETWIRAVMRAESCGEMRAISPKGMGLMQIMPETWPRLRVRCGLGTDPECGATTSYNAGPTRYDDHLTTGRPLPVETRAYVADVGPLIGVGGAVGTLEATMLVAATARAWTEAPLFPVQPDNNIQTSKPSSDGSVGQPSPVTTTADLQHLSPSSNGLFVSISQRTSQ